MGRKSSGNRCCFSETATSSTDIEPYGIASKPLQERILEIMIWN